MLNLPRLQQTLSIVNNEGKPTPFFVRLFNDAMQALEQNEAINEATVAQLQATIAQVQETIVALQASQQAAQAAVQAANAAQATADAAAGGGAVSGSASGLVNPEGPGWQLGPQVDLTGVIAGDLTITGSGPQQTDGTTSVASISGEWRVVEIVGMTETTVFSGSFSMTSGTPPTVVNESAAAVAAFSLASTSTGAVSYRIDAQRTDGGVIASPIELGLYIFARRA